MLLGPFRNTPVDPKAGYHQVPVAVIALPNLRNFASRRAVLIALMLVGAMLLVLGVVGQQRQRALVEQLQLLQARTEPQYAPEVAETEPLNTTSIGTPEQRIDGLLRMATAQGLHLRTFAVRREVGFGAEQSPLQVDWLAQGPYLVFRRWQAQVQHADAGMALQRLQIRPLVGGEGYDGRIEARMTWAMLLEPPAEAVARPNLMKAARDPFAPVVAPAPPPPPPVPAVAMAPTAPPAALPSLTFVGRMRAPDGSTSVLAQWSDGSLATLRKGQAAGQGFVVDRLGDTSVELVNPSTQALIQLVLPPEPRFETR